MISPSTAICVGLPTTSRTSKVRKSSRLDARSSSSRISAMRRASAIDIALSGFNGTHAIGHTRMATESDVDIRSAHPYWAYPFEDISVVHNGQLTNYWTFRRAMERRGHRFVSDCDSELIAVYVADRLGE